MQVAAMNPIAVCREEVPAKVVEQELEIARDKAREEGKPENMVDRIAQGRLNKFYKENVLMEQEFVSDNSMDIATYLKKQSAGLKAISFRRVNLNED